jgi:hypothetical protein
MAVTKKKEAGRNSPVENPCVGTKMGIQLGGVESTTYSLFQTRLA